MIEGQQITDGEVLWEVFKFVNTDKSGEYALSSQLEEVRSEMRNILGVRSYNTEYALDDVAKLGNDPSMVLVCIKAGTSSGNPLNVESDDLGTIMEDGTIKWLVCDANDSTPIGNIRFGYNVPAGYIKANGSTVDRADYPRLVRFATENNLWTETPNLNPGLFGIGDGETTMVLPDFRDKMIQLSDSEAGSFVGAGLPNIMGSVTLAYGNATSGTGSISVSEQSEQSGNAQIENSSSAYELGISSDTGYNTVSLDASASSSIYGNSTTVQPPAIKMIPIIRY